MSTARRRLRPNEVKKTLCTGFTLIELLIVISLITITTGAILPSFNNYINNQFVKQGQEQIKDDLRTLQNRALNGEQATKLLDGDKVEFWGVEFTQNTGVYTFFISVNTSTCGIVSAERQNMRTSSILPGENVIRSANGCIFFSYDNGDAIFSPAAAATVIVGPAVGATGCRRVNVTANGLIQTQESAACT